MTYNTERTGFWTALKDVPSRMSLRLKLVTALLVLVGLALAVTTLVGNAILKNYLLEPVRQNLSANQGQPRRTWSLRNYSLTGGGSRTSRRRGGLHLRRQDLPESSCRPAFNGIQRAVRRSGGPRYRGRP